MKHVLCLMVTLMMSLSCLAQGGLTTHYNMSYLNMVTGLPNNFVDDIYQDSYGFIWISTRGGGLVRFDGYSYFNMGVGSQGVTLRSNFCRNVYEDDYHRLWIAFEEYVDVMDLQTMRPIVPQGETPNLTNRLHRILKEKAIRVFKDTQGYMWILTGTHVHRLQFDRQGDVENILSMSYSTNAPDVAIADVSHDGSVLVGYGGSLHRLVPQKNHIIQKDLSRLLPQLNGLFVTDIIKYRGELWFATNAGLFCNDRKHTAYHHHATAQSLSHDFVTSLAIAPDSSLLIGTLCGVDILAHKTKQITHWNMSSAVNPLSSNFVNCLLVRNGQIWVGTETGGIVKLIPRELNLANYLHTDAPGSLSANAVNAMYVEPNGTLWVGNVEGGLSRKTKYATSFTHYMAGSSGLPHNSVCALAADSHSRLWIGTWGGGICWLDRTHPDKISRFVVPQRMQQMFVFIGALIYDSINDGLWIGSNDGLFFYDFKTKTLEDPFKGCRDIRGCVGCIVTKDGTLMMGCLEGMVEVNLKSRPSGKGYFRWKHLEDKLDAPHSGILEKITSFCQTQDGTVWLGSNGYGLYKRSVDKSGKEHFKVYTAVDGLANNAVKGIVEDRRGLLWITTDQGLSHFNPHTGIFTNYSSEDGLLCSQFYWNSAVRSREGIIYLGSEKGLTAIYGENNTSLYKGNLRFTRLSVDNQIVFAGSDYLKKDISLADEISLDESDKSFTIEFSSLNYGSETQGVYSYRMKGFENEWIPLKPGQHSVRYSTLSSGSYEFQVKYSPDMTGRNDKIISIGVHVTPYFWKSWWFLLIILVLMGALARWAYLHRIMELHNKEVEQLYRPIEVALKESSEPGKLQARIQNILDNQQRYVSSQKKTVEEDKKVVSEGRRSFMEEIMAVMESNYGDSNFGVTELCEKMKMQRVALSRRLAEETGIPASQFIRHYRLDIAKRFLEENEAERNITEIAYKVGFNDPKYFTRCFTKEYGISPSAFKSEK